MKSLFYVLTLVAGLAASYFSYNNSQKHKELTAETKEAERKNVHLDGEIRDFDDKIKNDAEELSALEKELSLIGANVDEVDGELAIEERDFKQLEADLLKVSAEIEETNLIVKKVEDVFSAEGVQFDEAGKYIEDLENKKNSLSQSFGELEANIETAEEKLVANNSRMSDLEEKQVQRQQRLRSNGAEATVTAVNHDWGFVVVDLGKDFVVTAESELLVKRHSNLIGKLKLSSIETGRIVCDIDYDTMMPGVTVEVGDKIFHGKPVTR